MQAASCLTFAIECGTLAKGVGAVAFGLLLFGGSVYLLLSAVLGRWMGYLVLMVAFSGWMLIHSSLWLFGFFSQGPETPVNLGPRGVEPAWVVLHAGDTAATTSYPAFRSYPAAPWYLPGADNEVLAASMQSVSGSATSYLAEQANEELHRNPLAPTAIQGTQFLVDSVSFARAQDDTPLAVVQAHFVGGGPQVVVSLYHDSGSVPVYSVMFVIGSALIFGSHVPLLDRAERKRKEFLTGGAAPAWYGPA